ncbi:MazG nucleotide pyrophosphohydrolase domain-containing protein [Liquorilactobacillus capillatus]|uniref:Pyrophosphatase n=1 Tax=Liquorilactobacillus capillatus DSM 19910 TaxID=1423731 RepID=A0A0R1LZM7_9LACO|nr:MazG-like family protein [Liquorilactobacillus capillatus]KRL01133.1 pyrophosphatase [Liquorilactobacillus capillatus DSM 19910]
MGLEEHQAWLVSFYKKRDWYKFSPEIRMNFLTEEVGELARAIRTFEIGRDHPGEKKKDKAERFDNLKEELADVVDQVLILCRKYEIEPQEILHYSENKLTERFKDQQ